MYRIKIYSRIGSIECSLLGVGNHGPAAYEGLTLVTLLSHVVLPELGYVDSCLQIFRRRSESEWRIQRRVPAQRTNPPG